MTHNLQFRENGTFTIVKFTDLHVKNGEPEDELTAALMAEVLDAEQPDLVALTGDVIDGGHCDDPAASWQRALAPIVEKLWELDFIEDLEVAGSIRRKEDLVKDADILLKVDGNRTQRVAQRLATYCRSTFKRVNSAGKKKIQAVLDVDGEERNVDILITDPQSWGAALNHFTGSKAHNIWCREQARKKGYTFNEYGVYKVKTKRRTSAYRDAEVVETRERVGGANEMDLFEALGIGYVPPEKRTGGPYKKKDFTDPPVRPGRSGGDIPLADSVDMERFRLIMD